MSQKPRIYFENLDGLRFICFLSVFLFHSFHTDYDSIRNSQGYAFVKWELFGNGNLGVNFFFVLSGFLITFLLISEREFYGRIDILSFWRRRIFRIWPLFYFCVFFGFVIFPFLKSSFGETPNETANPIYYLTFLNNFDFIQKGPPDASVLGVLWSVAIEEQFYFIWPVLLLFLPTRFFPFLFSLVIVISLLFRWFYDNPIYYENHTLSCMGDLAVGAFGAWLVQHETMVSRLKNLRREFIVLIYLLVAGVFFLRGDFSSAYFPLRVFERTFIAFLFLLVILEQNYSERSIFKMRNFENFSRLGVISYGLYCLHFIGILITTTITSKLGWNTQLWQVIFLDTSIALLITVGISSLSYYYFESIFLRMSKKISYFRKDVN
jgi:peptidoglycan/LPS O-acetylase OafA/YrhL